MKSRLGGLVFIVAMSGCGSAEPAPAPQAVPPAAASRPAPAPSNDAAARARAAEAERQRRASELANARSTLAEIVFFAYDRSDISSDARAILDRKARILREQSSVTLRVEGHADERGSTEYNLALGSRRAESVRAYLVGIGINASRLQATTYGESRPLARGTGETTWSRNRRAEFAVSGLPSQ